VKWTESRRRGLSSGCQLFGFGAIGLPIAVAPRLNRLCICDSTNGVPTGTGLNETSKTSLNETSKKMSASQRQLTLLVLPEQFIIARFAADAGLPSWATHGRFFSITRTSDELSIVCAADQAPLSLREHTRWRALKVRGPIAFPEIGVLSSVANPLAEAKVSVFVVSTFETDYILVNSEQLPNAIEALHKAGHTID